MTLPPHAHQQLAAFNTAYADPLDVRTHVDRLPGTADAACLCDGGDAAHPFTDEQCTWPFCAWHPLGPPLESE